MASFGLEGPGLNSGQRGKRQTAGPSALGAPAAKRARRPERAGAFADGDAAPGAPPPRPRLGKTKVSRPAAGERRDFGLNLPATASRDAYRNAVGAFPGMAAHRRPAAPPVAGAPPLRRRDGPSVGDMLEAKRRKIDKPADTPQGLAACFAAFYPGSKAEDKAKFQQFVLDNTLCPRHVLNMPVEKCESMLQQHGFEGVVVFTFQSRLREVCLPAAARGA